MKYFVMILISIIMISLFQFSEAREIGPFTFKLDKPEGDWIERSDSTMTEYYGVIQKGSTINLPLHILPTFNEPTQLEFHATIGDQMGPPKLPRGIHVKIDPESFILNPNQEKTINIEITADKNTPSNVYSIGIVGVWPKPINNFQGTSIKIHVGRDFGPNAVPDNFYPSPLKQTREGSLPSEIACTNNFVLVIKNNGNPACVKPTTAKKLIERGWGIEERFQGLTKSQIDDVRLAELGCKKTGNQTYCDIMLEEKIAFYLQQNQGFRIEPEPEPIPEADLSIEPITLNEKYFQDLIDNHDLIIDGTVTFHTGDRHAEYKIMVHEYLKNDLGLDEISAVSDRLYTGFMTGDHALIYLNQVNSSWWEISKDSVSLINKDCTDARIVLNIPYNSKNACWTREFILEP